ncbi:MULTISPECIES: NAD-dependent epimerase/dehydratase family protein [unclassified Arthrobacter]|uniref:polysaccharide biosynthesis C-terminal domain-containing protein n=1 Tax=unclassified Arthrobacter TaxID=235627 RepID=UPI0021035BB4|nr:MULTISPECIES: NAD-dependent epimerase/dehydratase family protein [unclassified Arthrobacter]MCQ1945385.1 capsular biosynthesis protein [Arthrobacter sp. zg-Y1116]MCQ1985331.1 capsular biosynthesis protein [Arthrobacter sp. zg-Y844]MCQ1994954.1 capsular biosynthesis protein [Arthrobacter sp. zg-Y1171]UWX80987.1 capsular biosynthesis protein [Arthrobacter sp. zg-Y1171]
MSFVITGGNGFLGWHTRVLAHSLGESCVSIGLGDRFNREEAVSALAGADTLVHIAGVNRGTDEEVAEGNLLFATQLEDVLAAAGPSLKTVVYANSVQQGNGTVYGQAKADAGRTLAAAAARAGAEFKDIVLPNLFGEHGVPFYNSVVATFCHLTAAGETPTVQDDKVLTLLHAQDAAELLLGVRPQAEQQQVEVQCSVSGLLERIQAMAAAYETGTIPRLDSDFERNLFNTYRSFLTGDGLPRVLELKTDPRGSFVELIRSEGGEGQSSFSTTKPGITRGQHYHRHKIERFVVMSGTGEIAMRRMFSDEVVRYSVNGEQPVAIDMPTMWSHNITNVGPNELYTAFWVNEIFDPASPDTFPEEV